MNQPSIDLMALVFPDVPLTSPGAEFCTLLSIDRARKVLGYEPRHSWRDHVSARTESQ
jgi:nucleoside-diphosphate-sugar epimerase